MTSKGDRMATELKKLATPRWPARSGKAAVSIGAVLLSTLSLGCPAQLTGTRNPEQVAQEAQSRAFHAETEAASVSSNGASGAPFGSQPFTSRTTLPRTKGR